MTEIGLSDALDRESDALDRAKEMGQKIWSTKETEIPPIDLAALIIMTVGVAKIAGLDKYTLLAAIDDCYRASPSVEEEGVTS
jgi:hypothetical protein